VLEEIHAMSSSAVSNRPARQVYIHVDVSDACLHTQVEPAGQSYRFPNNRHGVSELVDLCRGLGVSKITMKGDGGECEFARHSLSFAGVSVTVADALRETLFAARARRLSRSRRLAAFLTCLALLVGVGYWQWSRVAATVASTFEETKKIASESRRNARAARLNGGSAGVGFGTAATTSEPQKFRALFGELKSHAPTTATYAGRESERAVPRQTGGRASKASDWANAFKIRKNTEAAAPESAPHGDVAIIVQDYANSTAYRTLLSRAGRGNPQGLTESFSAADADAPKPPASPRAFSPDRDGVRVFEAGDGLPPIVYVTAARELPAVAPPNQDAEAINRALRDLEARRKEQRKAPDVSYPRAAVPSAPSVSKTVAPGSRLQQTLLSYTFDARKPAISSMKLVWPIWNRFDVAVVDACSSSCFL
jgi:hypothetical protein